MSAALIDEAVLYSFERALPADGLAVQAVHANDAPGDSTRQPAVGDVQVTQLRHDEALEWLAHGIGAMRRRCDQGAAWDRIASAAAELPKEHLARFRRPHLVRNVLRSHFDTADLDTGDTLNRCMEVCARRCADATWTQLGRDDQYGLVKLSRTLVIREFKS